MGELIELVAEWRERERQLEAGLDPKLIGRLDDLRAEHARSVSETTRPRRGAEDCRSPASTSPTDSPGNRVTPLTPAVASVKTTEKTKPGSLAGW